MCTNVPGKKTMKDNLLSHFSFGGVYTAIFSNDLIQIKTELYRVN